MVDLNSKPAATLRPALATQQRGLHMHLSRAFGVCLALAVPAFAGQGERLAEAIVKEDDADRRSSLLKRVKNLAAGENLVLVQEATRLRREGEYADWARLAPALPRTGLQAGIEELGAMARSPLDRHGPDEVALELLAQDPSGAGLVQLLYGLWSGSGSVRRLHQPALVELFAARPDLLAQVPALDTLRPPQEQDVDEEGVAPDLLTAPEPETIARWEQLLATVVREAYGEAQDPSQFLMTAALRGAGVPAWLGIGLAEGIVDRAPPEGAGEQEMDDAAYQAFQRDERALEQGRTLLLELVEHEDPRVMLAAIEAAARAFKDGAPDVLLRELIVKGLANEAPRELRDVAWKTLKSVTKMDYAQTQAPWQAWWERRESLDEGPDDEEGE